MLKLLKALDSMATNRNTLFFKRLMDTLSVIEEKNGMSSLEALTKLELKKVILAVQYIPIEDLLTLLKERDFPTLLALSKMLSVRQLQEVPANKLVVVAKHSTKEMAELIFNSFSDADIIQLLCNMSTEEIEATLHTSIEQAQELIDKLETRLY